MDKSVLRIDSKMTSFSIICFGFAILFIVTGNTTNAARLARSPQFGGGFSKAQASAQSGGFGFSRPRYFGPPGPSFGPPGPPIRLGFGQGGFGQGGFGQKGQGASISISKSISISRGGVAQSSAQSGASGK